MLKLSDGSAYIMAMTDGGAGTRRLSLPPALAGATSVEVVGENRTIAVTAGSFTDTFAQEYTHHIYRVSAP